MVFSFLYLAVRALFGALLRSRRGLHVKDIELLVLREGCQNSDSGFFGPLLPLTDLRAREHQKPLNGARPPAVRAFAWPGSIDRCSSPLLTLPSRLF